MNYDWVFMIHIRNASLSYGTQKLFDDISLAFLQSQRIGVLGRNGTGKSTLLKVLAGFEKLDEGAVEIDRNKKIGYMPQEVVLLSDKNVLDEALSVFESFRILETDMKQLEARIDAGDASVLEQYAELHEKLSSFNPALARERTEKILKGLGFSRAQLEQPVAELSVGWKMRLALGKLLLEDADFYLFDEPTNHLDLPTKDWFFEFLRQGRFGYLLVSHDRHFLDKASDCILSLERSKARLFHGNFSAYLEDEEAQRRVLEMAYHRQQKEITRKEETIARFKAKASKAGMAQSMMKQLDKIERIEIESTLPTVRITFPAGVRPGSQVLTVNKVAHAFDGKQLFDGVNGVVNRGDRIALVAPNGTGKTTLFNLVTGTYALQTGSIGFGHNVQHAVFEQDQLVALNPENTVLEEILQSVTSVTEGQIRSFLGCFLFSGDAVHKKIKVLSGGERNRVAMVKVLLHKGNFLLLDEPTNHLDLTAKDVLLQALKQYEGTILFVSHDRSFIESLATRVWELTPTGLYDYPGTYESYVDFKKARDEQGSSSQGSSSAAAETAAKQKQGKEAYEQRKGLASLESKMARLEKEIEELNHSFALLEYGTKEYESAAWKLRQKQNSFKELNEQWERASA